jgi:hypothetical protein
MQFKFSTSVLTLLWFVLFVPFGAISKNVQENPLTKAIQLFDRGKYAEAELLFKDLLEERPYDFMVNYFYGACRTNNGHYSDKSLSYLVKASREVNPLDIDYYIGVQNHAKENWDKAIEHYETFRKTASAEDIKKLKLDEKTEQCRNHINPFSFEIEIDDTVAPDETEEKMNSDGILYADVSDKQIQTDDSLKTIQNGIQEKENNSIFSEAPLSDSLKTEKTNQEIPIVTLPEISEVKSESLPISEKTTIDNSDQKAIDFNINPEITYFLLSHFKTEEGKSSYEDGSKLQQELEQTLKIAAFLREKYVASKSKLEKDSIGNIIIDLENKTYDLKSKSDKLLLQAKTLENDYWQNAGEEETNKFLTQIDLASKITNENKNNSTDIQQDTTGLIIPEILIHDSETEAPTIEPSNSDLIYKIQIGAFSRGIPNYLKPLYKKMELIRKVETYTDEKGVVVYTTGNLTKLEDAMVLQKQVRQEGVEDAYIVPYLKGKRITLEQAKEREGIK